MPFIARLILFLLVNFAALWIGALLQGEGPMGEWSLSLNTAPWTPPGIVFGIAWTLIMLCFSIYMALLSTGKLDYDLVTWFSIQFTLNVSWNAIFFAHHMTGLAMVVLLSLLAVVSMICWKNRRKMSAKSWLIAPYIMWLIIASSLNAYIILYN